MTGGTPPEPETIGALFTRLIEDGSTYVRAELGVYRARAYNRLSEFRTTFLLAASGLLLAMGAAVALCLGLVMTLARFIGPLGAAFTVFFIGLGVAALLLRAAWRRVKRMIDIPQDEAAR
jgi:hypothetical protein